MLYDYFKYGVVKDRLPIQCIIQQSLAVKSYYTLTAYGSYLLLIEKLQNI